MGVVGVAVGVVVVVAVAVVVGVVVGVGVGVAVGVVVVVGVGVVVGVVVAVVVGVAVAVMGDNGNSGTTQSFAFQADLTACAFDTAGRLKLTFVVDAKDKYAAYQLTDLTAKKFDVEVTAKGRAIAGPAGIEEAKRKVRARMAEREKAARAPGVFENAEVDQ